MRGPECSLVKPEGTLRIAVVGDSIAFGWGVKEEERYSTVLGEKLSAALGRPVEVLNFAVPGYNAMIEAALIEQKVSQFKPDMLILHFVNNDDSAPYFMSRPESFTTLQKSFLLTWIRERLDTSKQAVNPNLSTGFGSLPAETKKEVMQEYAYMVGPKAVSTALGRIGAWAHTQQVPLYIVFGSLKDGQYSLLRQAAKRSGAKLVGVKDAVERYFAERGIVTPEDRFKELTLNPKDPHPNEKGHRIYAEALFDAITKQ
jgi:lysophospholipase L1-like esterase